MATHMEAELSTVLVVGKTEDWSSATPQGLAAISITLVLLEQLQELHEHDPVPQHKHVQLLQMSLLENTRQDIWVWHVGVAMCEWSRCINKHATWLGFRTCSCHMQHGCNMASEHATWLQNDSNCLLT